VQPPGRKLTNLQEQTRRSGAGRKRLLLSDSSVETGNAQGHRENHIDNIHVSSIPSWPSAKDDSLKTQKTLSTSREFGNLIFEDNQRQTYRPQFQSGPPKIIAVLQLF
jgi:hypothetical protein